MWHGTGVRVKRRDFQTSRRGNCLRTSPEENGKRVSKGAQRNKIHPKWILITLLSRWGCKNASTLLRRQFFHGIYSVFCTSHIPKAAYNIAPKIQKLSSHAGKMVLDKPNIALQDLKIKKHPHRVNAHLPLGLYVDAKKNVLVPAHLASRIWPYSPPRSQHSPPSGPIRLHMTPDRPNIALKWPNMATWAKIRPTYSPPTDPMCCRAEHRPEVAQYKPTKIVNCQTKPPTWPWNDAG